MSSEQHISWRYGELRAAPMINFRGNSGTDRTVAQAVSGRPCIAGADKLALG